MGLSVLLRFLLLILQLELSELQLLLENSLFLDPRLFSHLECVLSLFQLSFKLSHPLLVQSLVSDVSFYNTVYLKQNKTFETPHTSL